MSIQNQDRKKQGRVKHLIKDCIKYEKQTNKQTDLYKAVMQ